MIINTNPVTLSDSGQQLDTTYISAHVTNLKNDKMDSVKADCQIGFFQSVDKVLIGGKMALRVDGFLKENYHLIFDYPVTNTDPFYFFDLKIKEHLLQLCPSWDVTKLVLTTEPVV